MDRTDLAPTQLFWPTQPKQQASEWGNHEMIQPQWPSVDINSQRDYRRRYQSIYEERWVQCWSWCIWGAVGHPDRLFQRAQVFEVQGEWTRQVYTWKCRVCLLLCFEPRTIAHLASSSCSEGNHIPEGVEEGYSYSEEGQSVLSILRESQSVQISCSVMSSFLRSHGLQHARLPCPSPTPEAYSNSCPSSQWCHPTISSSVIPFSSCLQSFPASGSFPMSQFFASGGHSIVASASVLPMNIQEWILREPLSHAILVSVSRLSLLAIN